MEFASNGSKGLEGALQDALGGDVDPGASGHLAIHHQPFGLEAAKLRPVGPVTDEIGVCDQHSRGPLMGAEDSDGLAGLHEQGLIGSKVGEGLDDRVVRRP